MRSGILVYALNEHHKSWNKSTQRATQNADLYKQFELGRRTSSNVLERQKPQTLASKSCSEMLVKLGLLYGISLVVSLRKLVVLVVQIRNMS